MLTEDKDFKIVTWVFVGKVGPDITFNKKEDEEDLTCYKAPHFLNGVIGGRYKLLYSKKTSRIKLGNAEYLGKISDLHQITKYETWERTENISRRIKQKMLKDKNDKAILQCLEPIRQVYRGTGYFNRMALEVMVLDYIRR